MSNSLRVGVSNNKLLEVIEPEARRRIEANLQPVRFKLGSIICEADGYLKHAYFPQGSVLSLLTVLADGSSIETANIGREGAFGLLDAMYKRTSFNRCMVQLEGPMVRCPIEVLQEAFDRSGQVRDLFLSYTGTLLSQVQQSVVCNAVHTTEERMCRWLLTMQDRAEGEAVPYTHEFLTNILGASRKSVTLGAQSMLAAGYITYRRGVIRVHNRAALEAASCECYSLVKKRIDDFLSPPYAVHE